MCALIIAGALFLSEPFLLLLFVAGTCTGVLLPDIHMSRPKSMNFRSIAWLLVQFPRRVCTPLLCRVYAGAGLPDHDPSDKRLTHAIPGTLFVFACTCAVLYIPALFTGSGIVKEAVLVFLSGILLGMALHLVEDLCTRKGIFPLYPFRPENIAGSIRPCDRTDPRIGQYHIQHCMVLAGFFGLESLGLLAPGLFLPVSILSIGICLGTMVYLSEVSLKAPSAMQGTSGLPAPARAPGK